MTVNQKAEVISSDNLTKAISAASGFRHADTFSSLVSFMTNSLQATVQSREYYFNELDRYRNNYIVNGIYNIVSNDIIADSGSSDFISISVPKYPEVEEEIKKLFTHLNISDVLISIMPELLHYGSYSIRPIISPGRGVIDLVDDLNPRQVIALTDSKSIPIMYFVANQMSRSELNPYDNVVPQQYTYTNSGRNSYEYLSISQMVYFSLDLSFSKLTLDPRLIRQMRTKAPQIYTKLLPQSLKIKTSQSFVWPSIDKLKEVLLLDKLSVYKNIGSILTPNIIGVPVPDVYDPNQLIDITKKYDELFNSNVARFNNTQNLELTIQELSAIKVVPIVGDRSTPQVIDTGRGEPIAKDESVNESMGRLLNSLGIPKELFDGAMESNTNLKTNVRYAKKVKRIQKSVTKTLNMLALLHISEKFSNLNVYPSDIVITLKNNINIDELENMESQDLIISSTNNIKMLLDNLAPIVELSSYEIDADKLVENIRDNFSSLGSIYQNIFKKKEDLSTKSNYTNSEGESFSLVPNEQGTNMVVRDSVTTEEGDESHIANDSTGDNQEQTIEVVSKEKTVEKTSDSPEKDSNQSNKE